MEIPPSTPSFYKTRAQRPVASALPPEDLAIVPSAIADWKREIRIQKIKSALFGAVVMIILGMIGTLLYNQSRLRNKISASGGSTAKNLSSEEETIRYQTEYKPWFGAPETALFMLDNLEQIKPEPIQKGQRHPINGTWIKQAGYHLVTAEKAYREGRLPAALTHYTHALEIYPGMLEVHRFMGLIHLQQKEYEQAITSLRKAVDEEPSNHALISNLGVAYLHSSMNDEAEAQFVQALRMRPGYETAAYNLAMLYYRDGRDQEAARAFSEYKSISPRNAEAIQTFASVLIRLERWDEAARELDLALTLEPDVAPIHFRLAFAQTKAGKLEDAMKTLTKAVSLVDAKRALAWLSRDDFTPLRSQASFQALLDHLAGRQTL